MSKKCSSLWSTAPSLTFEPSFRVGPSALLCFPIHTLLRSFCPEIAPFPEEKSRIRVATVGGHLRCGRNKPETKRDTEDSELQPLPPL